MLNNLRLITLLTAFTAICIVAGYFIGGNSGIVVAFGIAAFMNFFSYFFSDKLILFSTNATEIKEDDMPWLYSMVRNLTQKANLPMPKIFLIPEIQPNAFATGRNAANSVVGVTVGLLKILDHEEIKGVIAHELSHVRNNDMLVGTIAATLASTITILAQILYSSLMYRGERRSNNGLQDLLFVIFAPFLAIIIRSAISRNREYEADSGSVKLTKDKDSMISALEKITAAKSLPFHSASPASAHIYFSNPFKGSFVTDLLSTHPSLEKRVQNILNTDI